MSETSKSQSRTGGHGPMGGGMGAVEKPKNFKGSFKRLLTYLTPYKTGVIFVVTFAILSTVFSLLGPKILGRATTVIADGFIGRMNGTSAGVDFAAIKSILVFLIGLYLLSAIFNYLQQYIMAGVSQKTIYTLRKHVDHKLSKLPLRYYDSRTHGEILSRVTNDIDTIASSLQQSLTQIITAVTSIIGILLMMFSISPLLTLIALITLPVSMLLSFGVIKKSQKYFKGQQEWLGKLNGHVEEMYTGHNVIKLYSLENKSIKDFDVLNEELRKNAWKAQFSSSIMMPMINFVSNIGYVAVSVVGGILVTKNMLEIGNIQAFIQYVRQFSMPITQTAQISNILQSTVAAAERVFELIDEEEEIPETASPASADIIEGNVTFENVAFGYRDDSILIHNMNMQVNPGETIAIVGPTGAGKTTLVNLLMRFYDVNHGEIRIDGTNILDFRRGDLRGIFGMVLQDTWLFSGTILENIAYGKLGATKEEVVEAAKAAHVHHFIKSLPGTYNFMLSEDANNISQGQKQLLTIARAILADPQILILDEATSSVDTRTEVLIQKAMKALMSNRTSFVIAHRLSTIRDADKILVMKDGDIIEQGTHKDLMKTGGFYASLYNSQFANENPTA